MSVLGITNRIVGHQVTSSQAQLFERLFRNAKFTQTFALGDLPAAVTPNSIPVADEVYTLDVDSEGFITTYFFDLSTIPEGEDGFKNITFNAPADLADLVKVIYLSNDPDANSDPVRVYLSNDGDLLDGFWEVYPGDLRFLMINNREITGIKN